ncbi:unnamed protein product [Boreogadus saida]
MQFEASCAGARLTRVPISQSPSVEVESKKLPAAEDTSSNESDLVNNDGTQVFTSQATSQVDYSDSDDSMQVAQEKGVDY